MNKDRSKSGATPKRDAARRASVAKRRADLSGTAPWAFRALPAPRRAPRFASAVSTQRQVLGTAR